MSLFDIIGPVMIGPSSSHTAGAARIGRVARQLLGERPVEAVISFHGSFEKTYQGHGTDRAVVGGLLDMPVDDDLLRHSLKIAKEAGLEVTFRPVRLRDAHPNTVVVEAVGEHGKTIRLQAASIGGGRIRVQYLDRMEMGFSGDKITLVIRHEDAPGVISKVSFTLAYAGINIATMRVFRTAAGGAAAMAIELDDLPGKDLMERLRKLPGIRDVALISQI